MSQKTIIVIGNGMVGYRFLETMRGLDPGETYKLITFCEEPVPAYDRVHLTERFGGKSEEELLMAPLNWYKDNNIELHLEDVAIDIDRKNKTVTSRKGKKFFYDVIVMATGSEAFVPPVPGFDHDKVEVYRTFEDIRRIQERSKASKKAAVIGGGLLGLEAARALVDAGVETSVIEFAPRLMPRQIDTKASELLEKEIKSMNVELRLNHRTQKVVESDGGLRMHFDGEPDLDVDFIVVSAGIKPRDELARKAELEVGERGGIIVNQAMQTSDPEIYAIGECANDRGMVYGLVAPGYRMAEVAAKNILGDKDCFGDVDLSTKLKLMGVEVANVGDSLYESDNVHEVVYCDEATGVYKKMIIEDSKLKGAIMIGDTSDYGKLLTLYRSQEDLESPFGQVIMGKADEGDDQLICSCENVTASSIAKAVQDGCSDIGQIKSCTKAGTGCGSCVTLVQSILNEELEKSGVTVDKNLCEHFSYTRQDLMKMIRKDELKDFDSVIKTHGKGLGCEICKPAVGSILASLWNDWVFNHQKVQDTNDYYMANMQKNGTYSVVPRVPGGELTPEQLITIGEVARDYKLYTKITGGQRIDLFGAHLNDLPMIWERLSLVGLESGHAYAKGVRTVKSCVGSTWCRFGVQDSTKLAIDIENRYKGLRSPHKLKFAVSGCARECAEAQCKDVGVIATENGWNLYVAGNGGMKPQHALLLASDVDTSTLVKYIDRFLMYYIRTADRLTRTSVWFNSLEGGLDHLKEVILDDSLDLCEEMERDMQMIVDSYSCEWKNTIKDPNARKRFKSFANAEGYDENVAFEEVRGQIQPLEVK